MVFYLANLSINILIGIFLTYKNKIRNGKRKYLIFSALQLTLLSGLRGISVGVDTKTYYEIFQDIYNANTITELWNRREEFFYVLICKIVQLMHGDYQVLVLVTSAIISIGFIKFINDHSKNIVFSVFLLLCLGYFYTSFNGTRQYLATIFIINAFKYIKERKLLKYLFLVVIAYFFHSTAILFIPLYFVRYIKWDQKTIIIYVLLLTLAYLLFNSILRFAVILLPQYKHYLNTTYFVGNKGVMMIVVYLMFTLLTSVIFVPRATNDKKALTKTLAIDDHINYTLIMFTFALTVLSYRVIMIQRLAWYISAFLIVSIPNTLALMRNKDSRILLSLGVIISCTAYHIYILSVNWQGVMPYIPFWR